MEIDTRKWITSSGSGKGGVSLKHLSRNLSMKVIHNLLSRIQKGRLDLVLPDGSKLIYGKTESSSSPARIFINEYDFFSRVVYGGEVGLGEAYMEGLWDSDDLTNVLKLFIENREALSQGNTVFSILSLIRNFRLHRQRQNSLCGSRKNIEDHYDLSNEFYKTFLDDSMTYSCAVFSSPQERLEQAQKNKVHSIIRKAGIKKDDHVLEIGCGWGGFAVEAVKETQCRINGITISKAQYDYARERVQEKGLDGNIKILLEDYRTVKGTYDKIVSIEMLEAVGHEYLGKFFACCDRLLKPRGSAVIQVITIPDKRYSSHRNMPNWIKKHIFPGGVLPSLTAICHAMTEHSRLLVESVENIGIHYAGTLRQWKERFLDAKDAVSRMGFDKTFQRKWEYYFSICEAQFDLKVLNDLQIVLTREGNG
jgi:cyclopropane-fatty-acyl-phospholipid synthase